MKIIIKTLKGSSYSVDTIDFLNIYDLKINLKYLTGFEPEEQRLIFCGQELTNDQIISEIIGLENNTLFHLIYVKDDKNNINLKKIPRTQKKIIEELQIKVLSLEDRIDILEKKDEIENKKSKEIKNVKLEENIHTKKDFKEWVSNMIYNLDSREGRNNLNNKIIRYNDNGEFSITYEYRTQ